MNIMIRRFPALGLAAVAMLAILNARPVTAAPMGTVFTYQGKLGSGGYAAPDGLYDFSFAIYNAAGGGAQQGPTKGTNGVPVTNGCFMVALDFENVFPGDARWLDVSVRTNGGGSFIELSPRQPLTPVPYAIMASSASNILGNLPTAQLSGTVGNGQLANNAITVTAGTGLSGGGAVVLGSGTTLNNAGVLSVTGNSDITATSSAGNVALGSTATSANAASTLVKRDAGGNFSAGTITMAGNLNLPTTTSGAGIIYAGGSPLLHDYGNQNLFAGLAAGNLVLTGVQNTGLGSFALNNDSSGYYNTAIGCYSMFSNTNGQANTASGLAALYANLSGGNNTANGYEALFDNTTGWYNTAIGELALFSNTNGVADTGIGAMALYSNRSGNYNTASGFDALYANANGSGNTASGYYALEQNVNGNNNIALGYQAGYYPSNGNFNIDIGNQGLANDGQIIRIGTQGTQTNTFIAGIYNNTVAAGAPVYVDANGQLGSSASSPVALLGGNETFTGVDIFNNANDSFAGNGSALTSLNAAQLTVGTVPLAALGNAWTTAGNAGTTPNANFIGTTDNEPLELRVFNTRALRLDYGSGYPNLTVNPANNSVGTSSTYGSTIAGGYGNQIQNTASYSVIAGGYNNQIQTNAYESFIGGGYGNQIQSLNSSYSAIYGVIGGGYGNIIGPWAYYSVVGGGIGNQVQYNANEVGIAGGSGNQICSNANYSAIGGGLNNKVFQSVNFSTIAGGQYNLIGNWANSSTIGGGQANTIGDTYLGALGSGGSTGSTIGGGISNTVPGWVGSGEFTYPPAINATIAGGVFNKIGWNAVGDCIGGGAGNYASGNYSTIPGGLNNLAWGPYATVGGGVSNTASGAASFVGGGGYDGTTLAPNVASGMASVIAGGTWNIASVSRSVVGGGHDNWATNWYATVPGGAWNVAGGMGSFAAGQAAHAVTDNSFVWNCDFANTLSSSAPNQFLARADGGFTFYTSTSGGATLAAGSGSWTSLSDRNAKENFSAVDVSSVLQKVVALPLSTWNYKSQDAAIRHLGPMAQDFKAAFGVGETDTGISTVDADGVALAAIQGLNQKLQEKDAEIAELTARLAALETCLNNNPAK